MTHKQHLITTPLKLIRDAPHLNFKTVASQGFDD